MNLVQSSHQPRRSSESTERRSSERRFADSRLRTQERGVRGSRESGERREARGARSVRGTRGKRDAAETRRASGLRVANESRDERISRRVRDGSARGGDRDRTRNAEQTRRRSIGATNISASGARALGLSRRDAERPHGRGETARRVEAARNDGVHSRPAVYTEEPKREGLFGRLRPPQFKTPLLDVSRFQWSTLVTILMAIAIIALVIAMVGGPVRTYYCAWRDAGRSKAEYGVLMEQNAELNHEVERLQTLEGIEDEARNRGYVYPDEEALVVKGLKDDTVSDSERINAALEAYEQSLPWYVGYLDALFGYTHE